MENILKIKGLLLPKRTEKNAMKSQKVIFQKSQKLLAENIHEWPPISPPIQNIQ